MSKQPDVTFDVAARKHVVTLPSGPRVTFYKGNFETNVVSDPRDVRHILSHPDMFTVVKKVKTKHGERWLSLDEAKKYASKRSRQTATTKGQQQADESTDGTGANPPSPVTAPVGDPTKEPEGGASGDEGKSDEGKDGASDKKGTDKSSKKK